MHVGREDQYCHNWSATQNSLPQGDAQCWSHPVENVTTKCSWNCTSCSNSCWSASAPNVLRSRSTAPNIHLTSAGLSDCLKMGTNTIDGVIVVDSTGYAPYEPPPSLSLRVQSQQPAYRAVQFPPWRIIPARAYRRSGGCIQSPSYRTRRY